jgi:diadenosine tetraphosphate (Ap4A) HIT family hydrolase
MVLNEGCLFCKIAAGKIPCHRLMETTRSLAFLDINPVARGHILVIPKHCGGSRLHQVPVEFATECVSTLHTLASRLYPECEYNVLQNNGSLAHQEIMHVHFHLIPKRSDADGLQVGWPIQKGTTAEDLALLAEEMRRKL